ncbi:hypothetical protein EZV62_024605 [Acer yangbiense]|uniref:Reverse transcriptase Ty1/copia-type domain-containing protein n=1 Tax=Acer yangbiense TaxID=1000413 RepID=A0A5C7GVP9_9ROSI|nr:hypothetical protein EZV62_024605 [Acer yangbiense]
MQERLPPVNKIYSLIYQEEKQRDLSIPTSNLHEGSVLAVAPNSSNQNTKAVVSNTSMAHRNKSNSNRTPSREGYKNLPRPRCDHCGWEGHTTTTCYKLHEYPQRANNGTNVSQPRGFVASSEQSPLPSTTPIPTTDQSYTSSSPLITHEQYNQILAILQQGRIEHSTNFADGIFLCQQKYALDILHDMGMLGCRSARTPMEQNLKLNAEDGELLQDPVVYRRLIGHLIYLSITRPDIPFAVNILSRFMQTLRKTHLDAALRVLRYLKGSPGKGILLASSDE